MNTLIKILIAIAIIVFFVAIAKVGIARSEKVECYKLQKNAQLYTEFYITEAQDVMCFHHGVRIEAIIK